MSAVEQALHKLSQVVGKLETSVDNAQASMVGQQRDMFPGSAASNGNTQPQIDTQLVAQKLDNAIETIEGVLAEGAQ